MGNRGLSKGMIGLVVALAVAAGAGAYLLSLKGKVERATKPVEVSAPDLYPPDTLMFAALHRLDGAWGTWETWWNRFEPTATHAALREKWPETRRSLPPRVREALEQYEKALDEAEARFGHRPTTRDFFETYGKYTAFGLLPGTGGGPPRMLGVVRLPGEGAEAMLKSRLGGHGAVRPHDPAELHGYPVFTEDAGPLGRTFYGIGGGYLFLSDDAMALEVALGRLAGLASGRFRGKDGGPPCLSTDPVFARSGAAPWDRVRLALFVRRGQQFAKWKPEWKAIDDFLARAFVVAPDDPAVAGAVLAPEGGEGPWRFHASYAPEAPWGRKWEESLPSGMADVYLVRAAVPGAGSDAVRSGIEEFRGKALWKEIDAFVRDTGGLRLFLRECLGEESVPEDATLRRLPHDLAFVAALFDAAVEGAVLAPDSSWCMGHKVFEGDGRTTVQSVGAMEIDPLSAVLVAAAIDSAVEPLEGNLVRSGEGGVLTWSLDLAGVLDGSLGGPRGLRRNRGALENLESVAPAVVLGGGALYVVMGRDLTREVRDLAGGKGGPTLAADPLFVEAAGAVDPGESMLRFTRPAESMGGQWKQAKGQIETFLADQGTPREGRELLAAGFAAVEEALSWMERQRASVAATYADPARPSMSVLLLDPGAAGTLPPLPADPSGLRAPGFLPEGTFLLVEGRVAVRPAVERFVGAFLDALPGGREQWDEVRGKAEVGEADLEIPLDRLFVDIRGEMGLAVAVPPAGPMPEGPPEPQPLVDRAPALVAFAQYADAEAAFGEAAGILRKIHEAVDDPVPFEVRRRRFDRRMGPQPFGTEVAVTEIEGNPVALFTVFTPPGPRQDLITAGMGVVRRGDLLFFTTSTVALSAMARTEAGAPGTLHARLAGMLPAGTIPREASELLVVSENGLADWLATYLVPLAPMGAQLTLMGYGREEPPPDRIAAHEGGWKRGVDLFLDALRTGKWRVAATVEEGNRVRTVTVRVPGR